jgi:hypothetical protein
MRSPARATFVQKAGIRKKSLKLLRVYAVLMGEGSPMQIAPHLPLRFDTLKLPGRREHRSAVQHRSPNEQARRAGGPQDRALYTCGCGYAFTAAVSTSVGCPQCGTGQAW